MSHAEDARGSLIAIEFSNGLPFVPKRFFSVYDVPSVDVRGEMLTVFATNCSVALAGSLVALVDDGEVRAEVTAERPIGCSLYAADGLGSQFRYHLMLSSGFSHLTRTTPRITSATMRRSLAVKSATTPK